MSLMIYEKVNGLSDTTVPGQESLIFLTDIYYKT